MKYDYFELVSCMRFNTLITINGFSGYIRAIEQEDGSGKKYNVKLLWVSPTSPNDNRILTFYVEVA